MQNSPNMCVEAKNRKNSPNTCVEDRKIVLKKRNHLILNTVKAFIEDRKKIYIAKYCNGSIGMLRRRQSAVKIIMLDNETTATTAKKMTTTTNVTGKDRDDCRDA